MSSLAGKGALVRNLARTRDREGFARLRELCAGDPGISKAAGDYALRRTSLIVAAKGGRAADDHHRRRPGVAGRRDWRPRRRGTGWRGFSTGCCIEMGIFGEQAPARLREFRTHGQLTPDELIDRYELACQPVRDLLVDYLRERQPALDYKSLKDLSYYLGKQFWQDLERHHPGIDSLRLPREVADAWKQRQRTKPKTITAETGEKTVIAVERISYRQCLTPVRCLLPRSVPVGDRGSGPLGAVGYSLPRRPGGDRPAQVRAPPQSAHGRAHPRTATSPPGPGAHRRRPAQGGRNAAGGRSPDPARGYLHRGRPDPDPLGHQDHHREGLGGRSRPAASDAISASKRITPSGPGRQLRFSGSQASASKNCSRLPTTA